MRLDFSDERIVAVVAHPDDAELLCVGTLARARDAGAAIAICVLCQGDKGQASTGPVDLATTRGHEMKAASNLLQAELFTCGFPDGTLVDGEITRRSLIEVFRKFRPRLVLAHAPTDYHSDHRAAGQIAEAATWFCASRGHKTDSEPLEQPPALWWMDTINLAEFDPGFFVDVSAYSQLKEEMLLCHTSQLQRDGDRDFTPLVGLMQSQQAARGAQADVAAAEAFRIHPAFKRARAW